ncbi:MAG: outer membrane protein assembly factor BamD [Pseudomonadota bacterium]
MHASHVTHRFLTVFSLIAITCLALSGCGSADKKAAEAAAKLERPPEQIYNEAAAALKDGKYTKAIQLYQEVERQHPYSELATKGQVMAAYAAYQNVKYDEAIIALDRFIELHPGHPDVAYAYYLKALCYYEQISDVKRDQEMTRLALQSMTTVIERFPNTDYAREATLKRDLTLDHLAGKEMEVGRYYLKRGYMNAAINRFMVVIRDYQTTTHTPEALHRLVESYKTLGLENDALRVAAVLGYNYPGSKWYEDSYLLFNPEQRKALRSGKSWVDRTIDSLLRPS